jgi:YNFM family putative membrane transporter
MGANRLLWIFLLLFLCGIALTAAGPLPVIILGVAILTAGFFGAHSIASAWVGRRAGKDRAQAASFYLFFYYTGGSILGSAGGFAWTHARWPGVVFFAGGLIALGTIISALLARTAQLPAAEPAR